MGLRTVTPVIAGLLAWSALWAANAPFDGDIGKLAAKSPDQPVTMQVEFAAAATTEGIADLVFANHILGLSASGKHYSSSATYQTFSFSFSDRGPPKEEQLQRATCNTVIGSQPFSAPGQDQPLAAGARATYIQGSVILTASQAKQWSDTRPALIERIGHIQPMDPGQAKRARELLGKLFKSQVPVVGVSRIPPDCEKYMIIKE